MERLWSYLRSFSKITKEMTPAHRMDLLSDALLHFGSKKKGNIGIYTAVLYYYLKRMFLIVLFLLLLLFL